MKINLIFISNFKPNFNKKIVTNNSKLNCKNFLIFLLVLRFFLKKKISIFVKPQFRKIINILKAPYKNKLSRTQITFSRYFIIFTLNFFKKNEYLNITNNNFFINFYKNLIKILNFFEIGLCNQKKIKCFFNIKNKKYFNMLNY